MSYFQWIALHIVSASSAIDQQTSEIYLSVMAEKIASYFMLLQRRSLGKLKRKVIYDYLVVGRGEVSEMLKRIYYFCSNTRRFAKLNVHISFIPNQPDYYQPGLE